MQIDLAANPGIARLHRISSQGVRAALGWFDRQFQQEARWILAIALIAVLQLDLIWTHHPWLDEWQALQITLQSPDLSTLLLNFRFEGHPPLWYFILGGVARLGVAPDWILPLVNTVLAAIGLATILLAAPFRRSERFLLAGSEMILFEFLTVSRSLSLGAVLLLLIAATWNRRIIPFLLIAALPLCDFLFGVISIGLIWLRWREGRLWHFGAGLWLALSALSAWSVRPAPGMVPAVKPSGLATDFATWFANLSVLGMPLQWHKFSPTWNHPPIAILGALGIFGFFGLCFVETRKRRDDAIFLWVMIAFTLVFSLLVYPLAARHLLLIAMVLVLLVWRRHGAGGDGPSLWFGGWLLVSFACSVIVAGTLQFKPFDSAHIAAAEIRRLGLRGKDWVAFPSTSAQGIAPLNAMMFERPGSSCRQDFIRWNYQMPFDGWPAFNVWLRAKAARDGRFYLVTELPMQESALARRIAVIPTGYNGQDYNLFEIAPNLPDSTARLPRCNGPATPFPAL